MHIPAYGMFRLLTLGIIVLSIAAGAHANAPDEDIPHIAWSLFGPRSKAVYVDMSGNAEVRSALDGISTAL